MDSPAVFIRSFTGFRQTLFPDIGLLQTVTHFLIFAQQQEGEQDRQHAESRKNQHPYNRTLPA